MGGKVGKSKRMNCRKCGKRKTSKRDSVVSGKGRRKTQSRRRPGLGNGGRWKTSKRVIAARE